MRSNLRSEEEAAARPSALAARLAGGPPPLVAAALVWPVCRQPRAATTDHVCMVLRGIGSR